VTPPAGWYPDPSGSGRQRYFDGANWTENYAPTAAAPPPVRPSGNGRTLAIVFGILGVVVVLFVGVAVLSGVKDGVGGGIDILDRAGSMNEPISDGKFTFTVTGVDEMDSIGMSKPRGKFIVVDVTVKNTSDEEQSFQVNDQKLIGSNGAEYRADWMAGTTINDENTLLLQLGPGFSADYKLPFDLPPDVKPNKVDLHHSPLSGGATVKLT
jgi:hypothetical protein